MTIPLHIGTLIEEEVRKQQLSVSAFARRLHCDRTNVYDIFKRSSIDTEQLFRICKILNRNFFDIYSMQYYKDVEQSATEVLRTLQQRKLDTFG